jgi:sugar transferase (PEP-CTERM/EpsH1 system associated)
MRILFLTSRMPSPPVGGDRFRVYHILRTAAEAGHRVDLVTFDEGRSEASALEPLRRFTSTMHVVPMPKARSWWMAARALPSRLPLQAAYYQSDEMSRRFASVLEATSPDAVYTHLFRMAPYALAAMPRRDARWILDFTDVISAGIARSLPYRRGVQHWLYREEARRIARYEALVAPRFDACWVISEAEASALGRLAPRAKIRVVANGVESGRGVADAPREASRLLFFGNLDVLHNADAARFLAAKVLPLVQRSVPGATLDIAGKGSEALASLERRPGVRVLGFVPDLDRELGRASVFVAPHRFAAGVQNKVLQAFASGTPVVTTPVVLKGLAPAPTDIARVGADAPSIAAAVVSLLENRAAAAALGARGRAWAVSRFTWRDSLAALETVDARPASDSLEPARVVVAGA